MTNDVMALINGATCEWVDPDTVCAEILSPALTAQLAASLAARHPYRYRSSRSHPNLVEQVDANGVVVTGRFKDGDFHPCDVMVHD